MLTYLKRGWLWLWRTGWLITIPPLLAVVLFIWCWPRLQIPPVDEAHPHTLYLLSAIAQSLAAVLALVFTISLVVAQLSSRYSHRMLANLFDVPTILYILLFIAAVLLPFFLLAEPNPNAVRISLSLAAASIILLVPYFLSFKRKLDPEHLLSDLKEEAVAHLRTGPPKEPEAIATIYNFAMSAFTFKDYDTFGKGVETLASVIFEVNKHRLALSPAQSQYLKRTRGDLLARLRDIGLVTIEDPVASLQVVDTLGGFGAPAIPNGLEDVAERVSNILGQISTKAIAKSLDDVAVKASHALERMGVSAVEQNIDDLPWEVAFTLDTISVEALEKDLHDAAMRACWSLCNIGIEDVKVEEKSFYTADDDPRTLGNKRLAQWVCHRLGSMGVNMASKGQKENVSEVTSSLWDIGAWATLKDDSGTKEQVISSLKRIENEVGSELIKSTYEELANHLMEMMETLYGYEGEEYGYRFHALLDFNAEVTKAARVN